MRIMHIAHQEFFSASSNLDADFSHRASNTLTAINDSLVVDKENHKEIESMANLCLDELTSIQEKHGEICIQSVLFSDDWSNKKGYSSAFDGNHMRWRTMLYIASIPGFILIFGMQFAVDSPHWLCKVGRLGDAKAIIQNLWGAYQVERAIEEFHVVIKDDGSDGDSRWVELLEEPYSRGCIKVVFTRLFLEELC